MSKMSEQITDANEVREQLLAEIRKQELRLNSLEIQDALENESDQDKKISFIQERKKYVIARVTLENAILKNIAARLKPLESDLKDALKDLDVALQNVKNTVEIIKTVGAVTGILARVFMII